MPKIDPDRFLAIFDLPPEKALTLLAKLGIKPAWSFEEMMADQRKRSFVLAKVMSADVLQDVRKEIERALEEGTTLADFKKSVREKLARRGWLGEVEQIDPETGAKVGVKLNTPWRLATIFEQNIQNALNAGRYSGQLDSIGTRPYGQYNAVSDGKTTDECRSRDGIILPLTDPWWGKNYPSNHMRCRARVDTLSEREFIRMGGTIASAEDLAKLEPLPKGFDRSPLDVFEPDMSKYDPSIRKQLFTALTP
jgi:SPP1 gp7 family putative phage head morphogenesis protein